MSERPRDPARIAAFRTLQAVSVDDAYANLVLPGLLRDAGISGRDAALATELGYGTLRARGTLDEILRRCLTRPLDDVEAGVLDLLRLGAYQLLHTRIPSHAAVASTVDLARSTGNGRAAGFVNAVLRRVAARDFDGWCDELGAQASPLGRLALRYSHPGWIVGAFDRALGGDAPELEAALAADDARPETHLVGFPGRAEQDELAEAAHGEAGPYSPYAVRMSSGGDPGALEAVRSHHAGVQDEGSQLCAIAVTELEVTGTDDRWLDLCAGPGGKAALLGALAARSGATVTANELHPHRAELVRRATEGWPVSVIVGDARELAADERGYDRVLLDAPCTGLGALRRRPEARWRKSASDLQELVTLQHELLTAALRLVRVGGVVGYVTCSPHPAETTEQVAGILAEREDVALVPARGVIGSVPDSAARLGEGLSAGSSGAIQLWPHRHGTDAMFFAGLRRTR